MATHAISSLRSLFGYRFPPLGARLSQWLIRRMPQSIECELFPGIRLPLNLRDLTQQSTFWRGSRFERPTAQILEAFGAGATTFFDIGSNYGFFSYWMLHRLPKIEVHSFEPNPATFALVCRTKESNRLDRLHPHQLGLADKAGSLELHPGHDDSGHSTFTNHPLLHSPAIANVPIAAFDEWRETEKLPPASPGDWITKIDVEGFELKVLRGMRQALAAKAFRLIAIELNEYTLGLVGTKPEEVVAFLEQSGYASLEAVPGRDKWDSRECGNRFFVPKPAG